MNVYRGFLAAISAAIIVASMASCRSLTTHRGSVEALVGKENVHAFTYVVVSGNEKIANDDIKFEKLKSQLEASLRAKNFHIANDVNAANAIIFFTYNVGDAVTKKTGTTAFTNVPPPIMIGGTAVASPVPVTTMTSDTYSTTHTLKVMLDAYRLDNMRKVKTAPLWNLELVSNGSSNDMRSMFPYYLDMMGKYYGKDSGGIQKIKMEYDKNGNFFGRSDEARVKGKIAKIEFGGDLSDDR